MIKIHHLPKGVKVRGGVVHNKKRANDFIDLGSLMIILAVALGCLVLLLFFANLIYRLMI